MKYMLLIHQGETPTPRDAEAWAKLSEDEQKAVYADYQAINQTPGVAPGPPLGPTTVAGTHGEVVSTQFACETSFRKYEPGAALNV